MRSDGPAMVGNLRLVRGVLGLSSLHNSFFSLITVPGMSGYSINIS